MHRKRGGKVMARWGLQHLQAIAPLGSQAAAAKRQEKQVRKGTAQREAWDELPPPERGSVAMPRTGETGVYWPEEWPV